MYDRNFIKIAIDPPRPIDASTNSTLLPDTIYLSIMLRINDFSFSIEAEPAIPFLREYHTALVNAVLFEIPSICSMFSTDVSISITKSTDESDAMRFGVHVAGEPVASLKVKKKVLSDIFLDGALQVITALRSGLSFNEIATALWSPMVPLNEDYLSNFFGGLR